MKTSDLERRRVYVNYNPDPRPIILPTNLKVTTFIVTEFTTPGVATNGVPLQEQNARWAQVKNLAVCMNGFAASASTEEAVYRYRIPSPNELAWQVDVLVERIYPIETDDHNAYWNAFGMALCMNENGSEYYLCGVWDNKPTGADVARTNVQLFKVTNDKHVALASTTIPYVQVGAGIFSLKIGGNRLLAWVNGNEVISTPAAASGKDHPFSGLLVDGGSLCTPIVKAFTALAS